MSLKHACAILAGVLALPVARSEAQARAIYGAVRDSAGLAVENAELEVIPSELHGRSTAGGSYRMAGVPYDTVLVTARRLGFLPQTRRAVLSDTRDARVDFSLRRTADLLDVVNVTAARQAYDARLEGFNRRSKQQVGHFVTRDRIDRSNTTNVTDVLREVPGVMIGTPRNQGRMIRMRGSDCAPLVFVDGFPATAGDFDVDMIDLKGIEGIEVYAGLGSIPPEFTGPRDLDRCGVIAIWSRPFRSQAALAALRADAAALADTGPVRTISEVDVPARPVIAIASPRYPDSLLVSGLPGRVVVEVVVDTLGRVEPSSIDVLASTHALFTAAVQEALLGTRFVPATVKGRKVRQLLQLPFTFRTSNPVNPDTIQIATNNSLCDSRLLCRVDHNARYPLCGNRKRGVDWGFKGRPIPGHPLSVLHPYA